MDSCKHLSKIKKWNHSILNPQKWMCYFCGTTESVWACLSCPSVACGRYNEEHALKHYQEKQHPLCIEVNERYVYCYECDDYVLNDNASGDLKILRSALSAIATQSFTDVESRGRRLLRSYSQTTVTSPTQSDEDDKLVTADFHRRKCLLRKIFTAWRQLNQQKRIVEQRTPEKRTTAFSLNDNDSSPGGSPFLKRRTIIPGITGLRNLGNTCYMNSVLQVLSHLSSFREFFIKRVDPSPSRVTTPDSTPINSIFNTSQHLRSQVEATTPPHHSVTASCASPSATSCATPTFTPTRFLSRQTTFECFEHLMTPVSSKTKKIPAGGLNGGSLHGTSLRKKLICSVEKKELSQSNMSLCQELNGLFRVLWSGRWAQVSPHAFLQAVWQHIPAFKGHAQHDAQEFLCEMLDKVQTELESRNMSTVNADIINDIFRGQLVSQVKCLQCNNISERTEPFLDLSLEFPERYQITQENSSIAQDVCHITEMMYTFTEIEKLDGKIYCCEKCNANRSQKSPKSPIYTQAQKQFLVGKLPSILRLHLKRFRWSGRLHREKISTSVGINDVLDMQPFCTDSVSNSSGYMYNLLGVIVHHGRGFGSGHYTAYCWNSEAESWVHCNDSRMKLCSLEEVLQSQSYILVYTHVPKDSKTSSEHVKSGSDFQCSESEGRISQEIDDDITFNFKPPPENERLIKRKFRDRELLDTERVIKRRRSTLW